jgi:hypothetical protein
MVSAGHPTSSVFVPSTIEGNALPYDAVVYVTYSPDPPDTALDSLPDLPAFETRYPCDQWPEPPISQHAGSDILAQVLETDSFPNLCGGPAPFGSAAVPNQLHFNLSDIPDVQEPAPTRLPVPPHGRPHDHTKKVDAGDNCANASARPMSSGASDKKSDNEWTGKIKLHNTRVPAKAVPAAAVGDPCVHAFITCI